jgi:dTDP-4-dehydrorhamnose reductase
LEFAKKAFEIQGMNGIEITPIKLETYNRLSKPPLFSALQNTNGSRVKILLPTWEDALYRFLTENEVV